MCGIVGCLAYGEFADKNQEKVRQEAMIFFTTELLQLTQPRGKDATGIAVMFANCDYMGLKMGIPATDFISRYGNEREDYEGFLTVWRKKTTPAKIVLGHCRKPSTGGKAGAEDNMNNHPIKIGEIVGVHNGTLTNEEKIFERLGGQRDGKVDSEAIFRLIHKITNEGAEPFSMAAVQELTKRLHGTFSCLAFNGNNPYQAIGFLDGRPMVFALIRPLKLLLIASDMDYLKHAMWRYNKLARLYVGAALKFPPLRQGDLDTKTAPAMTNYMFDLRIDVGADTRLENVMEETKIVTADKIWGPATKAATGNAYGNQKQYSRHQGTGAAAAGTPAGKKTVAQVDARPASSPPQTSSPAISESSKAGMIFDKNSGKFVPATEEKKATEFGDVTVDVETGSVRDLHSEAWVMVSSEKKLTERPASSDLSLQETDKPVDSLISEKATLIDVEVKDPSGKQPENSGIIAVHKNGRLETAIKEEVDFTAYPDVVELADEAAKNEPSFSNAQEVADALEIRSVEVLQNMELQALANRIKRFYVRKAFYEGFVACLKDSSSADSAARNLLKRARGKNAKAQSAIRCLKSVLSLTCSLVNTDGGLMNRVEAVVTDALNEGQELRPEEIAKIIQSGSLPKEKTKVLLNGIQKVVDDKAGR